MKIVGFACGSGGCTPITEEDLERAAGPAQTALFPELMLAEGKAEESAIPRIFARLVHESRLTGQSARTKLYGGAELVVLVADGMITLTMKRQGAVLGIPEEYTFRRDAGVPADAERIPPAGLKRKQLSPLKADIVHYCGYRWPDPVAVQVEQPA